MDKGKRSKGVAIKNHNFRQERCLFDTPQLNALDVHSICLPSRSRKVMNWGSLHTDNHYQQQVNPQIIYSPHYQQLYSQYLSLRQQHSQQKGLIQQQIQQINATAAREQQKKHRLHTMRDGLYIQIEHLREGLNEVRDKNYNLRWQIYHQRGAHYMNVNGMSFLHGGEMSYQQLLQMEEQMGNVPKGLTLDEIGLLPTALYLNPLRNQQICCICFDELQEQEQILTIQCQHLHHKDCLRDWLLKQRVCPICKQQVSVT